MPSRIYMICDRYESGYGHGVKNDGLDLSKTPHVDAGLGEAYQIGYEAGQEARTLGQNHVVDELKQQRDELLAAQEGIKKAAYYDGYTEREREVRDAIQALEDAVSIFGPEPDQPCLAPKWYERAVAAIAKVKG